ncbi:MAG: (2Fe-2S)-binding protein [Chloroflexi bacterium]|nr:MAG: (2Fe-2S)-binding protein [Chloroflexota bacterium]TMB74258.1 MAG: (2Fe-2S)-binding protein [Chloroflexota bacterium]TMC33930.1 MAG: (2Fe-2S)-binding protein [Chloroflexota bacterium]TMC56830.1 MAG: (2Fe-2S)-binding protein [Chloroflexota bacterium]
MSEQGGDTSSVDTASKATQPEDKSFAVTRRSFLIGAGAGAATAGAVLGGVVVIKNATSTPTTTTTTQAGGPVAATMRRVNLDIDGKKYDLVVDNRESLWETMNFQLGLQNSNLGCDRAQCGACAVLVDGKAVNGCTVLSARMGRGQKITTVASLPKGPGLAGLHPVQRAFWLDGGFQCGICTRGFIMSTVALLAANPKPTTAQIQEGLAGNICRCGEYAKIYTAVNTAAAEMRGEKVTHLASAIVVNATGSEAAPTASGVSKEFTFTNPLDTIESFDPLAEQLKKKDGILGVSGSERNITIKWDPAKLDETKVRTILSDLGKPVR